MVKIQQCSTVELHPLPSASRVEKAESRKHMKGNTILEYKSSPRHGDHLPLILEHAHDALLKGGLGAGEYASGGGGKDPVFVCGFVMQCSAVWYMELFLPCLLLPLYCLRIVMLL